ncbi:MAG: recombinase RecA [Candidatus Kapabacteria bacterium]|nr:recombinase RecA [Candidatus Kapabacteria bacterium]
MAKEKEEAVKETTKASKADKNDVVSPAEARKKAIQAAMDQIEKDHGKGAIMRLSDKVVVPIDAISTGCISLDNAIGIGGVPRGRIIEIYGPESSGKTTICLHIIAEAQKNGGVAAFIDTEHALDIQYARRLGVDLSNLLLAQPEFGEQALEIVETLVRSSAIDVVIIDSVAALTPRVEIEGDMGDAQMGSHARLMSQAMRKLNAAIGASKTTVMFTNQLRSKIGVMYGNPETTTGGNALKFYASVRMDIRRKDMIKEGDVTVGNRVKIKIVKNKVAPPFKEVEFDILYNEGISKLGDMIDLALEHKIIAKSGSWFSYRDERAQGRDAMRIILKENAKLLAHLEDDVKKKLTEIATQPATNGTIDPDVTDEAEAAKA